MGDANMGNWPAPYAAVSDATRALRFEEYTSSPVRLIKVPEPLDALEETLRWVRRFDDKKV